MNNFYKAFLIISGILLVLVIGSFLLGNYALAGPLLAGFFVFLAVGIMGSSSLQGFSFTVFIAAAVTISMSYPTLFIEVRGFELKKLIVPLLQLIMFGMGTTMSVKDFAGIIKMPKGVLIGILCQFTIMPFIGFGLARLFGFPDEIAAGIILVGSSPSGLASNVMSFIAKANLALSITLTAVATLLAPLLTPLLMKWLAGEYIPIDVLGMMWSIVKIVIIPIIVGLIFNKLAHGKAKWLDNAMPLLSMICIGIIITIITAAGRDSLLSIGLLLIFSTLR